jgi:chorismate--pyruvate lyase
VNVHARLARFRFVVISAVPHTALAHPPRWLTASQLHPAPAAGVRDWLFNQDSLTRRLTALSADSFSVTPLTEGWQRLRRDECSALNVAAGSQGWVREVYLRGHGQPWVFARSVAARSALEGSGLALEQLGSRSLGELLFSDRAFERGELQACHYPAPWLPEEVRAERLWARRSCFSRGALGVLVAEVFLPEFWPAAEIASP